MRTDWATFASSAGGASSRRSSASLRRSRGRPTSMGTFSVSMSPRSSSFVFVRENVAFDAMPTSSPHLLMS